jgi:hypothetical protein
VARNTLAKANLRRNWRIYADFAQVLIAEARKPYAHENTFLNDINHMAYALDSTTIAGLYIYFNSHSPSNFFNR